MSNLPIIEVTDAPEDPKDAFYLYNNQLDSLTQRYGASYSGSDYDVILHFPKEPPIFRNQRPIQDITVVTDTGESIVSPAMQRPNLIGVYTPTYQVVGFTGLSVNTYREVVARRPLGYSKAAGYGRGARTVAGSFTMTVLRSSILRAIKNTGEYTTSIGDLDVGIDAFPPFDILLFGANEQGQRAQAVILGVRIISTAMNVGVFDKYTEEAFEFVAENWIPLNEERLGDILSIEPWKKLAGISHRSYGPIREDESLEEFMKNLNPSLGPKTGEK